MASSDRALRALTLADISAAAELNAIIGWNQVAADWRIMLKLGNGYGVDDETGRLIGTAITLPYGAAFAWISMVLVAPEYRRQGLARRLMQRCIERLAARGLTPVLDATPAGRMVYSALGFRDVLGMQRLWGERTLATQPQLADTEIRRITDADWPELLAYDTPIFGADRGALLRHLQTRLPHVALLALRGGQLAGYLLGRDGRTATQLGPLVATDAATAKALLSFGIRAVSGRIYIDLLDCQSETGAWLADFGFRTERSLTRMALGRAAPFGDPTRVVAVAGPELG